MGWLPFTAKQLWHVNHIILPSWLMIGWDARHPLTKKLNICPSLTLAAVYASIVLPAVLFPKPGAPKVDFFSLEGVVSLFRNSNEEGILAAWVHYVIFDMWTAQWIATDYQTTVRFSYFTKAYELGALFLTMMFGPVGLATYFFGKFTFLPAMDDDDEKAKDV